MHKIHHYNSQFAHSSSAAQIKGRVHIDLYDFVERILSQGLSTEVLSLDRVSQELLGEGKTGLDGRREVTSQAPADWKDIERAWKQKDLAGIGKYCLRDSELALKLAGQLLPQIFEISRVAGQMPFDV